MLLHRLAHAIHPGLKTGLACQSRSCCTLQPLISGCKARAKVACIGDDSIHYLVSSLVACSFPPACLQLCWATTLCQQAASDWATQQFQRSLSSVSLAACCPLQVFGPFTFYDVPGKESIPENASSYVNLVEVEMVLNVYTLLVTRCGFSWRDRG